MHVSFGADIGIVGLRIIDFCEHWNDSFRKFIHLDVPFLEDIDALLGRTATDMKENATSAQHAVDVVDGLADIPCIKAVQCCLLDDAISLEIRPFLGDINALPANASL